MVQSVVTHHLLDDVGRKVGEGNGGAITLIQWFYRPEA